MNALSQTSSPHYRPEIDGLRAIAVLSVMLYHAGVPPFAGGYLGVDIFFVISGYLITSILMKDLDQDRFSIARFYERRVRRILPALFLILLVTLPAARLWMFPSQLKSFGGDSLSAIFFSSNIRFWLNEGYFTPSAEFNPLLHTWSLGVEEQFYIFYPLILALIYRHFRRWLLAFVAVGALISFGLAEWAWRHVPSLNFYMLPTRAWELLAGVAVSLLARRNPKAEFVSHPIFGATGLALVLGSMILIDERPVPSIYSLPAVLGTVLLLLDRRHDDPIVKALSWRPLVGIGLISYSAYLWHQPIFAFARLSTFDTLSPVVTAGLLLAVFPLAYLSWRYVEQPFRNRRDGPFARPSRMIKVLGAACGLLIVANVALIATNGMARSYGAAGEYLAKFSSPLPESPYFRHFQVLEKYGEECNFYTENALGRGGTSKPTIDPACYVRNPSKKHSLLVWGDSHSQMYRAGLADALPADWQLMQIAGAGCAPTFHLGDSPMPWCASASRFAAATIPRVKPDVVLIANHEIGTAALTYDPLRTAQDLLDRGVGRVVIMGAIPRRYRELPIFLAAHYDSMPRRTWEGIDRSVIAHDRRLRDRIERLGDDRILYVRPLPRLCDRQGCLTYLGDDPYLGITSYDDGHLSESAALHVLRPSLARIFAAPRSAD